MYNLPKLCFIFADTLILLTTSDSSAKLFAAIGILCLSISLYIDIGRKNGPE